jgi:phosphoribosyl 1,2-cyclic phosphate phosphodiesterase
MRVEILGSGGATTTPRPLCACLVCVEARDKGIPYARSGPAVFVHGPDVLIDTPEEIKEQLNRSQVDQIAACIYSHWHPDHTAGRRVFEELNIDWRAWPPEPRGTTDVYLPQQVATDFRSRLGLWDHFEYMQEVERTVSIQELEDGDVLSLAGTDIRPIRLAVDYVYAFVFDDGRKRAVIAPDELNGWSPPPEVRGVDLAVLPMGILEFDPFSGERVIDEDHHVLQIEATFDETLEIVTQLEARRVILTHIEEMNQLGYDELLRLEANLRADGLAISFAYDTLLVDV